MSWSLCREVRTNYCAGLDGLEEIAKYMIMFIRIYTLVLSNTPNLVGEHQIACLRSIMHDSNYGHSSMLASG